MFLTNCIDNPPIYRSAINYETALFNLQQSQNNTFKKQIVATINKEKKKKLNFFFIRRIDTIFSGYTIIKNKKK